MIKLGILISGRGSNMAAILSEISAGRLRNAEASVVISNRPEAPGLETARKFGVPTEVITADGLRGWSYDQRLVSSLGRHGIIPESGLVCLAGFMRIISPEFVREYRQRIMNIHPALLPSFPGLHAQKQALEYGVKITGCTVHFVDEGTDTGPVILQKHVQVLDSDTEETLSERILAQEHILYPQAIGLFADSRLEVIGRKVRVRER